MTRPFITLSATGASGENYGLWAYPLGTEFEDVPGVYIFCRAAPDGYWLADYVGQGGSLQSRVGVGLFLHHKATAARQLGSTHVAVMGVAGGERLRCWVENDLIQALGPPLNEIAPPRARRSA